MQPLSETWQALKQLDAASIPAPLRTKLAELWSRDALLEHASVASFSKFSLHLMAVAAPPVLLDAAHRAALDEVQHARLCFALASAYAGEPLGPGPLPLEGDLLGPLDLPSITAAAVREGCVGETIASLEAAEAHSIAVVPAPREALSTIADDEARHAELAWRFVRWALDQNDDATVRAVSQAFREALAQPAPLAGASDPLGPQLAEHGRIDETQRVRLWHEGLHEVVAPAARALLGGALLARAGVNGAPSLRATSRGRRRAARCPSAPRRRGRWCRRGRADRRRSGPSRPRARRRTARRGQAPASSPCRARGR